MSMQLDNETATSNIYFVTQDRSQHVRLLLHDFPSLSKPDIPAVLNTPLCVSLTTKSNNLILKLTGLLSQEVKSIPLLI